MKSPAHLHRYLKNYVSTQRQEIRIIASYNVSFYKRFFFPLWHEALKRVSTEIWSFFLWKELLRLQTFFILMEGKIIAEMISLLQRQNSRLEYIHQTKNHEKYNILLIRQHKYLYYESIFSRKTPFSRANCRLHSITDFSPGNR